MIIIIYAMETKRSCCLSFHKYNKEENCLQAICKILKYRMLCCAHICINYLSTSTGKGIAVIGIIPARASLDDLIRNKNFCFNLVSLLYDNIIKVLLVLKL